MFNVGGFVEPDVYVSFPTAAYYVSISQVGRVALCYLAGKALRRRNLFPPPRPNKTETTKPKEPIWHAEVLCRAAVKPFPVRILFRFWGGWLLKVWLSL